MQNMSRTKFITGIGISSILTACGGGASGGSSSGGSSLTPVGPSLTSIGTQLQSITNSSSMAEVNFYLGSMLTGVPFASFVKRMANSATVKADTGQVAMYQVLQFMTSQQMIVADIFSRNALTTSQKSTLASFQKGLASNSFVQKMPGSQITSSTISRVVANAQTVKNLRLGPIPTPSPDKALDALVGYFNTLGMSQVFSDVNSSLISVMQSSGFAAWMQSQSAIVRGALLESLSSSSGLSTMGFRSLQYDYGNMGADFALPTRTTASVTIFAIGVATVGLAILAAPEVATGASLYYGAVAAARLSMAIVGGGYLLYNQIQRWNNGLDFDPPVPLSQSSETFEYANDPYPPSFVPDPSSSDPGQVEEIPGTYDGSDPNTPGTGT